MNNKPTKTEPLTVRKDFLFPKKDFELIKRAADLSSVTVSHFIRHFSLLQAKFLLAKQQQENDIAA